MDKNLFDEDPGIDGPDYVALVIEWDEIANTIEDEVTTERKAVPPARNPLRGIAAMALGALGVIAAAVWGVRRLRHA